jgi:hypothetical protein
MRSTRSKPTTTASFSASLLSPVEGTTRNSMSRSLSPLRPSAETSSM